ncbi:MAG: hypothetical protein QGD94_08010, partial [Planctomycetia bacterium]|nr:hypothetical protein [Planctomycetia bacterium]
MKRKTIIKIGIAVVAVPLAIYATIATVVYVRARDALEAIRAAGDPVDLADIVPPKILDEENAALLLTRAFEKIKLPESDTPEAEAWDKALEGEELTAEEEKVVQNVFADNAEALRLIIEALQRPKCRFDVDYEQGFLCELPHLTPMVSVANLLSNKAYWEMNHGSTEEAVRRVADILRFTLLAGKGAALVEYVLGASLSEIGLQRVKELLAKHKPNRQELALLSALVRKQYSPEGLMHVLKVERCLSIAIFRWWGGDYKRLKILSQGTLSVQPGEKMPSGGLEFPIHPWRIYCENDMTWSLALWTDFLEAAARPFPDSLDAVESVTNQFSEFRVEQFNFPAHIVTAVLMPSIGVVVEMEARFLAMVRMAQIAIAAEVFKIRAGRYPEKLDNLKLADLAEVRIDPFTARDFIYR